MTEFEDLITPVTYEEAKESIYEALATTGVDATMWKRVGVYRTLIAAVAIMFSVTTIILANLARMASYEYAIGGWLTLVARFVFGVYREPAISAQGAIVFVNTKGAVYDVGVGDVVIKNRLTNAEFTNLTAFTIAGGSPGNPVQSSLDVNGDPITFRAVQTGSIGTSGIGQIDALVTDLVGVTCSNPAPLVGQDEEIDESVRTRCREKLVESNTMGPEDKYASVVRAVRRPDGSKLGISSRIDITKDGTGNVYIDVANSNGQLSGSIDDVGSDLYLVDDAVQRYATPLAVTSHTRSKPNVVIPYTYEVWMLGNAGLSPEQVQQTIERNVTQQLALAPLGGFSKDGEPGRIYTDWLRGIIESSRPEIFQVELSVPSDHIPVSAGRPPVAGVATCLGIHQVKQRQL